MIVIATLGVRIWKARNPGAMTVLQAQGMDMSTMVPPAGPVPVATEVVHQGPFSATVTYTGSVAPLQEQVIYPRVEGYLKELNVYNGDRVSRDQTLAIVDSPDLGTKAEEASAGYAAARKDIPIAQSEVSRAKSELTAAAADVDAATGDLDNAQGMVDAARKAVIQAQKEVKSAQANLDYWRAEIIREESLLKSGAVSVQEYQSEKAQAIAAEAELETRQAKVTEAQADVRAAQGDLKSKKAAVRAAKERMTAAKASLEGAGGQVSQKSEMARQARAAAATASIVNEYRYVRAPFAGIVTKRYLSPGQFVNSGTAILSVVQIDRVRLQANVADKDLPLIKVGAPVTARFAKYPDLTISTTVTSVSPLANQNSKTVLVEAIVPNPRHRLVPGDGVTLSIATSQSAHSITVPAAAIVQKAGKSAVWIARSMSDMPGMSHGQHDMSSHKNSGTMKHAHLVMVTTGATDGRRTEILSGLSPGDEIIYEGNTYLREGDQVMPTEWGEAGPAEIPKAPPMKSMPNMPGMQH